MILINRKLLIILIAGIIAACLGGGWFGYSSIMGSEGLDQAAIRYQAEQFLFFSVVIVVILSGGFLILILRSRHVDRQLDRLIEMSRFADIHPEKHFAGLGPLGTRLKLVYQQINNLNIRKTLKISAMANLNDFLMNNIALPLLVTDVTGTIVYSSSSFSEKFKSGRGDIRSTKVDTVYPDILVPTLMLELSRQHVPVERESSRVKISCYPIHNVAGDLAYVVFVPDRKAAYNSVSSPEKENVSKAGSIAGRLGRLLARKRQP